jgi:hypothetical protein
MADGPSFTLRPLAGAKPLDVGAAKQLADIAGAAASEVIDDGVARVRFDASHDAVTAEGHLQIAARMALGAHWQTRYRLEAA